ncbi:MAG: hypothetical protein ACTTJC_08555 [Campylobacter sp.]
MLTPKGQEAQKIAEEREQNELEEQERKARFKEEQEASEYVRFKQEGLSKAFQAYQAKFTRDDHLGVVLSYF